MSMLCVRERGRRREERTGETGGGADGSAQPKTRTPHKDVLWSRTTSSHATLFTCNSCTCKTLTHLVFTHGASSQVHTQHPPHTSAAGCRPACEREREAFASLGGACTMRCASSNFYALQQAWKFIIFMSLCNSSKSVAQLQSL